MEKKKYTAPELVVLGKVKEITQGQRRRGKFGDACWGMRLHAYNPPESGGS
jgi:hypothetical protein